MSPPDVFTDYSIVFGKMGGLIVGSV